MTTEVLQPCSLCGHEKSAHESAGLVDLLYSADSVPARAECMMCPFDDAAKHEYRGEEA